MKGFVLLFALSCLFFTQVSAQKACLNNCTNNGLCDGTRGVCFCNAGMLGTDCSINFIRQYGHAWDAGRYVMGAMFAIIGVISGIATFFPERQAATIKNVRRFVYGLVCACSWTQFLYCVIDPWIFHGRSHIIANNFIFGVFTYGSVAAYELILFHWVEIYNIAVAALQRENSLMKINSTYQGKPVTIDDVVNRVKYLKKLKIPFALTVLLLFGLHIVDSITNYTDPVFYHKWDIAYYTLFLASWAFLSAGFLLYGRKLVTLMPREHLHRVRRLTHRITVFSVLMFCEMIVITCVYYATNLNDPINLICVFIGIEVIFLVWCCTTMCVFARRQFPYFFKVTSGGSKSDSYIYASKSSNIL